MQIFPFRDISCVPRQAPSPFSPIRLEVELSSKKSKYVENLTLYLHDSFVLASSRGHSVTTNFASSLLILLGNLEGHSCWNSRMVPSFPFEVIRKIVTLNLDPPTNQGPWPSRSRSDQNTLLCYSRVNWFWKGIAQELLFLYVNINGRTLATFQKAVLSRPHCYTCRVLVVSWIRFTRDTWFRLESILGGLENISKNLMLVFSECDNVHLDRLIVPGTWSLPRHKYWISCWYRLINRSPSKNPFDNRWTFIDNRRSIPSQVFSPRGGFSFGRITSSLHQPENYFHYFPKEGSRTSQVDMDPVAHLHPGCKSLVLITNVAAPSKFRDVFALRRHSSRIRPSPIITSRFHVCLFQIFGVGSLGY